LSWEESLFGNAAPSNLANKKGKKAYWQQGLNPYYEKKRRDTRFHRNTKEPSLGGQTVFRSTSEREVLNDAGGELHPKERKEESKGL